ncbi:hypothetical protein CPB85DRAFT_1305823, partial [Mucidula mucida]
TSIIPVATGPIPHRYTCFCCHCIVTLLFSLFFPCRINCSLLSTEINCIFISPFILSPTMTL